MRYYSIVLGLLIFLGCQEPEIKKVIEKFDNGKEGIVQFYKDINDTLNYRREAFYIDGKKYYIGQIVNGKKEGVWTWWYQNGKKKDQGKYLNGFYIDTVYHWFESGQIKQIEIIQGGRKPSSKECSNCCNSTLVRYYLNGQVKEKFTMINDIQQDTSRSWFQNGQLEYYAFFKDGKEEGISEWYYPSGIKKTWGQYENGKLIGKVYHWDSLGHVVSIDNYVGEK